ncbi:MAG: hypothetical protein J6S67_03920 [Methanobrevibacter sp.]|nr:hypothetical protein [Methanobrevibacter sp.]
MKINNTFLNVIKIAISGLIVVNFILNIIILKSNNNQDYDIRSLDWQLDYINDDIDEIKDNVKEIEYDVNYIRYAID